MNLSREKLMYKRWRNREYMRESRRRLKMAMMNRGTEETTTTTTMKRPKNATKKCENNGANLVDKDKLAIDGNGCVIVSGEIINGEKKTEKRSIKTGSIGIPFSYGETSGGWITSITENKNEPGLKCKPCSVVLERFEESELGKLLLSSLRKDSEIDNKKKKKKKRRFKGLRFDYGRYLRTRKLNRQKYKNRVEQQQIIGNNEFGRGRDADNNKKNDDEGKIAQFRASNYGGNKSSAKITTEEEDNDNKSIETALKNLRNKSSSSSPSKQFRLYLRKRNNANFGEDPGKIPSSIENRNKNENENMGDSRSKLETDRMALKRNRINSENEDEDEDEDEDENIIPPREKKYRRAKNGVIYSCEALFAPNSNAGGSNSTQIFEHTNVFENWDVYDEKNNLIGSSETPTKKNLTISLVKLSNSSESAEEEEKFNVIDSTDIECGNSCARARIYRRNIIESAKPIKTSPNNNGGKFRNRKITDFFMKINKDSVSSGNNSRTLSRVENDMRLKTEYGIFKEARVSLVDLKYFEIEDILKYGASRIEKLVNGNGESSSQAQNLELNFAKNDDESTIEISATEGVNLRTRNTAVSSNERDIRPNAFVVVGKNLYNYNNNDNDEGKKYLGKDLALDYGKKYFSKSNPTLNSSLVVDRSSLSFGGNNTQKTLERVDNCKRSLSLSPRKYSGLIISDVETIGPRFCATEIVNESGEKLPDKNSKEVTRKEFDHSVVVDNPILSSALNSLTKSPTKKLEIQSETTVQKQIRRLPPNTMTCLNFGVLNENGTCLNLENANNDLTTKIGRTENKQTDIPANNNDNDNNDKLERKTSVEKKTGSDSPRKKNCAAIGGKLKKTPKKKSDSEKPAMETSENASSTSASNEEVGEKADSDGQQRDVVSGINKSSSAVVVLEKISSIENYDQPIPVFFVNDSLAKLNVPVQPPMNQVQQESLVIDLAKMQVIAPIITENDTNPDKLIPVDSSSKQVEEACENPASMTSRKECIMCKKRFARFNDLQNHVRVHINDSNVCVLCDKTLTKDTAIKHFLEHCGCTGEDKPHFHACNICNRKFRKLSGMKHHLNSKHKLDKKRFESTKTVNKESNKCTICMVNFNSKDELFSHVLLHTDEELQNAYKAAKANQRSKSVKSPSEIEAESAVPNIPQYKPSKPFREIRPKGIPVKPPATTSIPAPTPAPAPAPVPVAAPVATTASPPSNCAVSICMCHKDERLQISGSVIIELALTCEYCKTFFKTRKCFKDHYLTTSCKWTEKTVVMPAMFCNKCCVILSSLQDMHSHLKQHAKSTFKTKSSFLCKLCNVYFFGIGSLFYTHWFSHCDNPLFVADHTSFPNNFKVKIVEPEPTVPSSNDDPMENLFVAEHQCHDCQEPFETEEDLRKHLNTSATCSKKGALDSRNKTIENRKTVFKIICSVCNKEFNDKPGFNDHLKEHKIIADLLELPKYLIRSMEVDQRYCKVCKTEFETAKMYKDHLRRHEMIREKYVCNNCSLIVENVDKFEQHSVEHKLKTEKAVACKVIFATSKFNCKPCKMWFDNQNMLDEHLATHSKQTDGNQKSAVSLPLQTAPAVAEEKEIAPVNQDQDPSREADPVTEVSTEKEGGASSNPLAEKDLSVFHVSDDSSSSDVEIIIPDKPRAEIEVKESGVRNIYVEKKKEASPKKNKPTFIRVKNLKELLPYPCTSCKMEFDTQTKLSNHVCSKIETQLKDSSALNKYSCTICNNYKCNSEDDLSFHRLSHFPLRSTPHFDKSWFNVLSILSDKPLLKCNVCAKYGCESVSMMRDHFINVHPNIYRPIYTCRVCSTFTSTIEQELRRHEAAHYKKTSTTPPPLFSSDQTSSKSTSVQQSVNINGKSLRHIPIRPAPPKMDFTPSAVQPSGNVQPANATQSKTDSTNNAVPQLQTIATVSSASSSTQGNNSSTVQRPHTSPPQPVESQNYIQQAIPTSSVNNSLPLTPIINNANNLQKNLVVPIASNPNNNPSSIQPINLPQQLASLIQQYTNQITTTNNANPSVSNIVAPPMAVSNPIYRCYNCKNFHTSSEKEFKAHESFHEFIRSDKANKLFHPCKDCPIFSCKTFEQLHTHFSTFHHTDATITMIPQNRNRQIIRKIFKCNNCPQTFGSSNDLTQHIYKSHTYFVINQQSPALQHNDMYPFGCHLCSINFASEAYLNTHLKEAHPNISKETPQKTSNLQTLFKCNVCQLCLVSQLALDYHMRSHNIVYQ